MNEGDKVQCKFFVAHEKTKNLDKNYMVDINNVLASANIEIDQKQKMLGLLINIDGENRLYFSNTNIGNSITSYDTSDITNKSREYLMASSLNPINLETILKLAGANIVNIKPSDNYSDLSPEALNKNSIINLIQKQ